MLKKSPNGYRKKKIQEILDIPEIISALDKYHYNNATFLKLYFEVIDRYDYSIYLLKNPNLQKDDETNSFTTYDDTIDMF